MIYVIEEIWLDPLENEISAAYGYKPICYTLDEKLAKRAAEGGKLYTHKDCWAVYTPMPQYRYFSLPLLGYSPEQIVATFNEHLDRIITSMDKPA